MSHSRSVEDTPRTPEASSPEADGTEYHLPAHHAPLPELVHAEKPHTVASNAEFVAVSETAEYKKLRSTFMNFAFPMVIAVLVSYFTYVLLSIYNTSFMSSPFLGLEGLNVGIGVGLFQFLLVYVWTAIYVRFMAVKIDKTSASIKTRLEIGAMA